MNTAIPFPAISDTPIAMLPQSVESKGHIVHTRAIPIEVPTWFSILRVFLFGKVSLGWAIIQPLPLNVEQEEDGTHIVSDDIFLVYGNGDTQSDAIGDYVSSLLEFYQLIKVGAKTDPFDQKQLIVLQSYIQPL